MLNATRAARALAAVVLASAFTACLSPTAMRSALDDKDAELRRLKDEHVLALERVQELTQERNRLQVALEEASMKVVERPRTEVAPAFPELDEMGITYGVRDGNVVISLPSAITFSSGSAALSESGRNALRAVGKRLQGEFPDATYHVEGHTDTDPIRKSDFSSNRELSLVRALAVLTYLVEECRIPDERCVVVGHGQYRPVSDNATDGGKARNRRVEIVVHDRAD